MHENNIREITTIREREKWTPNSDGLQPKSDASNLLAMASNLSNLLGIASNLIAMASNLLTIASNLLAMASNLLQRMEMTVCLMFPLFCLCRLRPVECAADGSNSLFCPLAPRQAIQFQCSSDVEP